MTFDVVVSSVDPTAAVDITSELNAADDILVKDVVTNDSKLQESVRIHKPQAVVKRFTKDSDSDVEVVRDIAGDGLRVCMIVSGHEAHKLIELWRAGARGIAGDPPGRGELPSALRQLNITGWYLSSYLLESFVRQLINPSWPVDIRLTPAEKRIIPLLLSGATSAQIGRRVGITERTVKAHLSAIYRKLDVYSRAEAVSRLHQLGIRVIY